VINGAPSAEQIPVGLELYSVRGEFARHPVATVQMVAKMGYQVVEFHVTSDGLKKAAELNKILGSTDVVMASAGSIVDLGGWKSLCGQLNRIVETLKPLGLRSGCHNHQVEFVPFEGRRPIEIIAAATPGDFMWQFDAGTCIEAGFYPAAWINSNPGRIRSIHCRDWAPGPASQGYRVLFGEGVAPWARIFEAAERTGSVEYYLIEQEGSRYPKLETAERCLTTWRHLKN
jgi:sugar phosphate isomerase/epimerase